MYGAAAVHPMPFVVVRATVARRRVKRGRVHVSGRRDVFAQQERQEEKVCALFRSLIVSDACMYVCVCVCAHERNVNELVSKTKINFNRNTKRVDIFI